MLREGLERVASHIRNNETEYLFEAQFVYFLGTQVMRAVSGYVGARHDIALGAMIWSATEVGSKVLGLGTPLGVALVSGTIARENVTYFLRRSGELLLNPKSEFVPAVSEFRDFARESRLSLSRRIYRRLSPVIDPVVEAYNHLENMFYAGDYESIDQLFLRSEYRSTACMPVDCVRILR